jgi:hypothetical protein
VTQITPGRNLRCGDEHLPSGGIAENLFHETFCEAMDKAVRQHGEYRTARLVLYAQDRLTADGTFERWA